MDRKIIIAVAPTGGWGRGDNNPVTPEAIMRSIHKGGEMLAV